MQSVQDPTTPLFAYPTVRINDTNVPLRRLGIVDLFGVLRIIRDIVGRGGLELETRLRGLSIKKDLSASLGAIVLMGLGSGEKEAAAFIGSIIGWSAADVLDPEKFPLGSETRFCKALAEHPDAKAFFLEAETIGSLREMLAQALKPPSSGASTESAAATAGPTLNS